MNPTLTPQAVASIPAKPRPTRAKRSFPKLAMGNALIGKEEEELVLKALRSGDLFRYYGHDENHPPGMTAQLEKEFAVKIGTTYALAVTSGTAALEVALGALGVGPGDEVIVPTWSWISCFMSIVRLGAKPVLGEIDESFCLAPGEITRLATPRTKAVIVVQYQGGMAEMDTILTEARAKGIKVLEDCAASAGTTYHGRRVGSMGDIGIFSFQFHKTITSGEGGMVTTNDSALYERAVRMHDVGQYRAYHQQVLAPQGQSFCGSQFRMSELTAAVALAQSRKLDTIRARCQKLAAPIAECIGQLPRLQLRKMADPKGDSGIEIYFFLSDKASTEIFRKGLMELGVPCNPVTGTYSHYARPYFRKDTAHHPKATPFTDWPDKGYGAADFPRTEDLVNRFIALPISVLYTEEDVRFITESLEKLHLELFGVIGQSHAS